MSVNKKMTALAEAIRAKTGKTAPLTLDQMVDEIEGISGSTELYAAIGVLYPEGSTCTCTKGSTVLTPKNTNGQWVFAVPEPGTWTVCSTDGVQSKSRDIVISSEGQFEKISLEYFFYLFQEGIGVAEGYECKLGTESSGGSISDDAIVWATNNGLGNQVWFTPRIWLADYTKLKVELTCETRNGNSTNYKVIIGVGSYEPQGAGQPNDWVAKSADIWNTERAVYEAEISHCNDNFYVKIAAYATTGRIHNIWFE
ncbi:MAG: hypothetical protein IIX72_00625 [Oscillospiraceae bacterium]|nr:hypothetical protein [Oscillospiraceae bacterium]